MSDLNLNINDVLPKQKPPKQTLLKMILLLQIIGFAAVFYFVRPNRLPNSSSTSGSLSQEQLLTLAQQMEDLDLPKQAADYWKEYIQRTTPLPEKEAKLWYRVGMISQKGRLYQDAIAYYAKSQAIQKVDSIENEIARRTQECLEQLGHFAAIRRDVQNRTDIQTDHNNSSGKVLAEIGPWKITKKDWEASIENELDESMSNLPPAEAIQRKKQLMKMFSKGENFLNYFQQFIFQELLMREAREQKLADSKEFQRKCQSIEKQFLTSMVMEKAVGTPESSEAEAQLYYNNHKAEFKKDEKQQPFNEVQQQITSKLSAQKRQDAQQKYFKSLIDKYDVVFHTSVLPKPKEQQPSSAKTPQPATPQIQPKPTTKEKSIPQKKNQSEPKKSQKATDTVEL